jgi:hypothetical protein
MAQFAPKTIRDRFASGTRTDAQSGKSTRTAEVAVPIGAAAAPAK